MNTSHKIVFFGTEDFSAVSLQALIEAGYTIAAVITKPDTQRGRGNILTAPKVKTIALDHSIAIFQPDNLADVADVIKNIPQPIGVLVSFGKIIPRSIIDLFPKGIINIHPSLLPKYRGPSPIEAAMLHGDSETGVSIMKITSEMDAGPIYLQQKISLTGVETKPQLYQHLAQIGASGLVRSLPLIISGRLQTHSQDDAASTYCPLLSKKDSLIDPTTTDASQAERMVRAYLGFPRSLVNLSGQNCIILQAHVTAESQPGSLAVQCQDKQFLIIDQLIAPSGTTVSGSDFLRGYS